MNAPSRNMRSVASASVTPGMLFMPRRKPLCSFCQASLTGIMPARARSTFW